MKILLDENLPVRLKEFLPSGFQWLTTKDMKWHGIKNGQLLKLMNDYEFNGMVTMDKNLFNQQNLSKFNIFFLVIRAHNNKLPTLQALITSITQVLNTNPLPGVYTIR
jgi:predicted nuclease of predicted toxin-antitoxin system